MAASQRQQHPVIWLEQQSLLGAQRLGLTPSMGGSVTAWVVERTGLAPFNLFRAWDGIDHDDPLHIAFASYPLVPWSNRISGGGFSGEGTFHAVAPNATGMPYPIHGDGWQQHWQYWQIDAGSLDMTLESNQFNSNPHHYCAKQTFELVDSGMDQSLTVTHLGEEPLPYGLGLHPWLPRNKHTKLQAHVDGVWLSYPDCLPKAHTTDFPSAWDLNSGISTAGTLIDNCFTGWNGQARVTWSDHELELTLRHSIASTEVSTYSIQPNYLLVYRPTRGDHFCLEPVSHPIDAFHQPGQPGLQMLEKGESLSLAVSWRYQTMHE